MSVKALAVLIPVVGGMLAYLVPRLWRGLRKFVFLMNDIVGSPEKPSLYSLVESLSEQVRRIDKELHPNGGSSMRDQIIRVEAEVAEVKTMATEAKRKAADAASEAEGLSGAVARYSHEARAREDVAQRERKGFREDMQALLASLQEYAAKVHRDKVAYVAALQEMGIDLTHVTRELDGDDGDG